MVGVISEEYRAQQQHMHDTIDTYGIASVKFAPLVTEVINKTGVTDILDYGAGKGRLAQNINPKHACRVHHYDPARPDWAEPPEPHEFVCCIDVLEHIEPECLDAVLDDLRRVTLSLGLFTVHTGPAGKTLPDGRNAHLIQEPAKWWMPQILERFELNTFAERNNGFYVIVRPLSGTDEAPLAQTSAA